MRLFWLFILAFAVLGCSGKTNYQMDRDLSPISQNKNKQLSQACIDADTRVGSAIVSAGTTVAAYKSIVHHQAVVIPDGSCVELIEVDNHIHALAVVQALKTQLGGVDSYIQTASTVIPIWIDEPHQPANPSQRKAGQSYDNSVTISICQAAQHQLQGELQSQNLSGTITLENNPGASGTMKMPCYLQITFASDATYESFLNWPVSAAQELFHINVGSAASVTGTVWIRAFSTVQSN